MSKAHSIESLTARFGRLSLDDPNPGPRAFEVMRQQGYPGFWYSMDDPGFAAPHPGPHAFEVLSQWTRAYPERFRPPPVSTSGDASIMLLPGRDPQSANLAHDIRTGEHLATDAAYEAWQGWGATPMAAIPDDPSVNPRPATRGLGTRRDARRGLLRTRYLESEFTDGINWF